MIGPQYKNIIQWTIKHDISELNNDSMMIAKKVFANLGVAFPHGDLEEAISILKSKNYLGWRQCSFSNVQKYANAGIASIGINNTELIIILPDEKIANLSADDELQSVKADLIKHSKDLVDKNNMLYFVYSYGFEF